MGSDNRVVDSARVSFSKEASNYSEEQNGKLISYLAKHGHWTPFSHPQITLVEKVPIFVARQRFKHMVGFTYNEVSRRYVDDAPEFYVPEVWRGRPENAKQGSSEEVSFSLDDYDLSIGTGGHEGNFGDWEEDYVGYSDILNLCKEWYENAISKGVAPEQARMVLPQAMYTEYMVTGSLAAFARAYKQRIDPHAQKEIQDVAVEWDKIIRPLFPISWSALVD